MTKRMLIDTTHAEETRVVVMDGDRVEDYDVETSSKKQLKGNIYLAKVIRVEPSLQAAFVEYGGNRHGFLAFSEIHPDYFQIPVADREKLLALQEEELASEQATETAEEPEYQEFDEQDHEERRSPETVGGEHDTGEESAASRRTARFLRNYKIQEVIRRRQVILVQVVKEERGNKGAALTTYISLAGRYCVLMPNALRGGGVSRKITSDSDRRRLREIIASLELPRSMAMIIRTAGAGRPGPEVVRDCEYLLQLWDDIRSHALSSVAPTLVYEEASLIKRAIRDLFSKDIEDITIDGEAAWKSAREFMRLLMPHNAGKVKLWQNRGQGLFSRYNVEGHLDAMFSPTAQLRSGGYLVINQTEALVAIDVNSGKSTSQRNIEETALRTNLEAAEEVARQLRLRDLAGLVVIDFIDMESRRHNAQVEKRLKDALRSDRARIQVGHISHFGLLEMSRQRLRPSISEAMLTPCPHCQGTGFVRGTESAALHVLRAVDEEGARQRAAEIEVSVGSGIALYILNNKRSWLSEIEQRHHMQVFFQTDDSLPHSEVRIERLRPQSAAPARTTENVRTIEILEEAAPPPAAALSNENETGTTQSADASEHSSDEENGNGPRRRRRRRRGGRRNHERGEAETALTDSAPEQEPISNELSEEDEETETNLIPGRRRTRFKRASRENDQVGENAAHPVAQEQAASPVQDKEAAQLQDKEAAQHNRFDEKQALRKHNRERGFDATQQAYNGPTPADPFGGSFDIFDIIEQAELNQVPAPLKAVARAVKAEQKKTLSEQPAEPAAPLSSTVEVSPVEYSPVKDNEASDQTATSSASIEADSQPKRKRGRPRKLAVATTTITSEAEPTPLKTSTNDTRASEQSETKAAVRKNAVPAPAAAEPAKPARRPRRAAKAVSPPQEVLENPAVEATSTQETTAEQAPARKTRARRAQTPKAEPVLENTITPIDIDDAPPAKRRSGWWKR